MTIYHIPGCPYSERVEILLQLKGLRGLVEDREMDISKQRPEWFLQKTLGTTAMPVLDTPQGTLKESVIILRYLDETYPEKRIAQSDPYRHAVESRLAATDGAFIVPGYNMVKNRDPAARDTLRAAVDAQFERLNTFLLHYSADGTFLFDDFGWAETAFTPLFKRLCMLDYYENYEVPKALTRVRIWREACLAHPAAQERKVEEVLKLYYDYSQGFGGGSIPTGRTASSFTLDPHWSTRPMPPRDKWGKPATDAELGLLRAAA
jgi:glutathione S-transferase